jgi:hypothetical protein
MSVETLASVASLSAPVAAVVLFFVLALLSCRAGLAALGFTLKSHASRWLDLSIAVSLVVFAVCVIARFKLIG